MGSGGIIGNMTKLELKAYAKVNIGLDVVKRLENGYHQVRMIMQTLSLHDTLTIESCREEGIVLTTDTSALSSPEDNLVYKAAKMMFEKYGLADGIKIHLQKRIPIAAGMAGGSTDAAAVFRGMNQLYNLKLPQEELMKLGVKLGADIPYCIVGGTYLSEGIGEVLTPAPTMPQCYVLVAKPPIGVSTKWVYENLHANELKEHPDIDGMLKAMEENNLKALAAKMDNVLEHVTVRKYPVINEIKQLMEKYGAVRAMMSGSGPTVFGLFATEETMNHAYNKMKEEGIIEDIFATTIEKGYAL